MLEPKLEYIPREFATNELPIKIRGISNNSDEEGEGDGPLSGSDNSEISDRLQMPNKAT